MHIQLRGGPHDGRREELGNVINDKVYVKDMTGIFEPIPGQNDVEVVGVNATYHEYRQTDEAIQDDGVEYTVFDYFGTEQRTELAQ